MIPDGSRMLVALCATWLVFKLGFAGFACLSNPCIYGICMDDINSTYSCYCIDGYTGIQCQTNWNECWSSPCQNGGTCIDGIAAYNCTCPEGFIGDECEVNYDECESNPCHNNGTCIDADNGYVCHCLPGYSGTFCEVDIAVCNSTEETRCYNGGLCVEGPGVTFTCKCRPGWTGKICEIEINECASSPCSNGAACIDLIADYACACHFGFTGKDCEDDILICEDNPCRNDAICLMEDETSVCYCVPDFHGERCQFQYDECQLGPRCMNGGTCVDGIDTFSCSCPPDLTGLLCECLILPNGTLDCTYIRPTTMQLDITTPLEITTTTDRQFSYDTTLPDLITTPPENKTLQVPKTTTELTSIFYTTELPSTVTTPFVKNQTVESTMMPPFLMNQTTESATQTSELTIYTSTIRGPTLSIESQGMHSSTSSDVFFTSTVSSVPSIEITSPPAATSTEIATIPTEDGRLSTTGYEERLSTTGYQESTTVLFTMSPIDEEIFSTTKITSSFDNVTTSVFSTTEKYPPFVISNISSTTGKPPITESTAHGRELNLTVVATTELPTFLTTFFTETPTEATTHGMEYPFSVSSEEPFFTTIKPTVFTEIGINRTSKPVDADCSKYPCQNGGTCVHTSEGPRCVCRFDTEGRLCEFLQGIQNAAFSGDSYLSHETTNKSRYDIRVGLRVKTLTSSGLIFYTNVGRSAYMTLYVLDGLLKFQFSCGVQTMVLSEMDTPVNNGYEMAIHAHMQFTRNLSHCNATLQINETLAMSGDQSSVFNIFDKSQSWLHLGGIPQQFVHDNSPSVQGFTGCMHSLTINGKKTKIFKDAKDGFEITECDSLACLSSPCANGATCVEFGDDWKCLCRNGFVGAMCEQSVCKNNPCLYGATCVPNMAGGYLCLCSLGKHGHHCEQDLEISEPSFSSTVRGYASYAAYPLLGSLSHHMELRLKFVPSTLDQISLLLFMGQDGVHDPSSDHVAVTFVKGYIMLTWNLGSGPRRIFTSHPVNVKPNREHTVRLGRVGRRSWLAVDNLGNVTGRSPGKLAQLDIRPVLYIGGHSSGNFSTLPHDLPLHGGFNGCIYDVEMRAGNAYVPLQVSKAATGRSVAQCGTTACSEKVCLNGGACLHHGPTFTCLCPDSWFGPYCSLKYNPCNTMRHNCSSGATCVPLVAGYECDCPLGKTGRFCEKDESLSDVSFTGRRSFLALPAVELQGTLFNMDLELRPLGNRGLVLYIGHFDQQYFFSLHIQGGIPELRLMLGNRRLSESGLTILRARRVLTIGEWHKVRVGRYGRRIFLWVDEVVSTASLSQDFIWQTNGSPLYLGGTPDLSDLPNGAVSTFPTYFTGCLRQLVVNEIHLPLNTSYVLESRNIADCDGTPCGGDVCDNGGSCWLDQLVKPHCTCPENYSGDRCQLKLTCVDQPCQNHGHCVELMTGAHKCNCPVGWTGDFCEVLVDPVGTPHFREDSFLVVDPILTEGGGDKKRRADYRFGVDVSYVYLNFSTANPFGMILWSNKGEEFIGIGLERGHLKLAWAWHETDTFVIDIPAVGPIADGNWHILIISFNPDNVTLSVDNRQVHSQSSEETVVTDHSIVTDGVFYLGGFPAGKSMLEETHGLFTSHFSGCIEEIAFKENEKIKDFSHYEGENIGTCNMFKP